MRKLLLTSVAAGALLVGLNAADAQRMNEPSSSQSPGMSEQAPRAGERAPASDRAPRTQREERGQSERAMERDGGAAQQERRGTAQQERRGQQPDRADRRRDGEPRNTGEAQRDRREQRDRARRDGAEERRGQAERRERMREDGVERERRSRADRDRSMDRDRSRSVERDRDRDRRGDRADRNRDRSRSVNLNSEDRVRVSRTFATTIERRNIRPLRNVHFSVSVGARVPRDIRLHAVPTEIVRIHPEFRGYRFVAVEDEIVIVEPGSYRIVSVLPLSGSATASTGVSRERNNVGRADSRELDLTVEQRRVIRERVVQAPICRDELRLDFSIGIPLPRTVQVCEFPREIVSEVPAIRSYRYVVRGDDVIIVDPDERRVIEVIE